MDELVESTTVEVAPSTGNPTREWSAIRDECISGGALTDDCNLIATSQGKASLEVIQKKLSCGCILFPSDIEEVIL